MNKLFTKIATLSVGLAMAIGVGVAVAGNSKKAAPVHADNETATLTFSAACGGSGTDDKSNSWTITSDAAESTYDSTKGIHYGTGKKAVSYLNLTTSGISGTITQIVVNASGASGTSAKLDVSVGGSAFDSQKSLTSSAASYTLTGSASGTILIEITQTSATKALYCKSVAVTYDNSGGGGGSTPTLTSISVSGEQTTYTVGDEFVKPTVTAHYDDDSSVDVTSSATFSGYDMNVAGEYTVTVSYGGQTTTYAITVNDEVPEGEVLYSATFTEVETHSYTQNKTFTLNEKSWTASVSQVNGGVFYLGTNSNATNAPKGILNDNETFSDVVTALAAEDSTYSSNKDTAHAYALDFNNAYDNVGSVEFVWSSANNGFQVYLFGDQGSGLELLNHVNYSDTTSLGKIKWTASGYGEHFDRFVFVGRPGATSSTATSKTIRLTKFTIIEGESASLIDTSIRNSLNEEGPFEVIVGKNMSLFYKDISGDPVAISGADWESSDPTVYAKDTAYSGDEYFYGRALKEGQVTMTASKSGYKVAQAIVNVVPDPTLPEMEVWDTSGKVSENASYYYSSTVDIYKFTARNVEDTSVTVDDAVWESSDTTVATVTSTSGQCSLTTLKPGELDLTVTSSSYQSVTVHIEIIKGSLEELNYDGNPSKTVYNDNEDWSADGVTISATYHSGWVEDVTSQVEWSFDPAKPAEGVNSVTFTASFGGESVTTPAWAVTVTHQHAGTAADPFNVVEGIAKAESIGNKTGGEGPWVTTGKISHVVQVLTTGYQNARFYITEDGKTTSPSIYAYDCKYLENAGFTEETAAEMVVGATVTITGNLLNYNNNTPEYARGCYLLDIQQPETGDITVTFEPTTSFEIGATGTFNATADDAEATLTWSVDDASVISVDSSTGAYEALGLGVARVTVTATHGDKQGTAFADIVVNGNEYIGVGDANAIAASLPNGKISDYYVYVEGYVAEFATSQKDGNPRALDIVNFDEDSRIMVYTNVDPYASFVDGLHLGDYIKVKAHVQNYNGTYELTSPEKIDSSLSAMSFAFELLAETDSVCADYDGVTDNKEALEAVWETLSSASWYGALTGDEQLVLQEADASETGTTIQKAMARYDYLVGKYKLDNFISGRTPVAFANQPIQTSNNSVNTNFAMIAVIVVAVTSLSAIGVLLVVKKRKYHN